MEMGADAVLINTAMAIADNPVQMAAAFKKGVEAGRMAFEAGWGNSKGGALAPKITAVASSPLTAFLD